jgi:hypothetical protein
MDLLRRVQTILALCLGLAAGCAEPKFAPPAGGDPNPPGTPPPGTPGAPGFMLPGGGTPTPMAPGAAPVGSQCAGEAYKAETSPLDLMLLIDSSASMLELSGSRSKWELAQYALATFVGDAKTAGLGVGLHFFPHVNPRACNVPNDCVTPYTGGDYCSFRQVCVGAGATAPLRSCSTSGVMIGCPIGQSCVAAGVCSAGGAECFNVGLPCPGTQGVCQRGAGTCNTIFPTVECEGANYASPAVPIGVLPASQPALVQTLSYKVPGRVLEGVGTPMGPAVRGIVAHLRAHLGANPGRKAALVLASDGAPSGCGGVMNDIPSVYSTLAGANTGASPIPTYVIGVFKQQELEVAQRDLNQLATAGGTGKAFVLSANDDLAQQLLGALNQIRGAALPCEYKIPAPRGGQIDYGKVNVRFTGTGGGEGVPYVETPARCDPAQGGWYYDVVPGTGATTRVMMCDATCRRFKADQNGKVDIIYGCATQVIN